LAKVLKNNTKIMIVVGENSGDNHAAKVVDYIQNLSPDAEFFGATGAKLREVNVETILSADNFSIVGLPEVLRAMPMFWKAFQVLKKAAIEKNPDVILLVDFPEFNLKFAKALKKLGFKVVYYISPQLWAWRKYRLRGIKRDVDLLLTILPFEKDFYAKHGLDNVEYVGNPLAGEVKSKLSREDFCVKHNLDSKKPIISLLPGSRRKEVERILPKLLQTALQMEKNRSDLQFIIALASNRKLSEFENIAKSFNQLPKNLTIVENETWEAVNASDVAAVTSGTATLETAIIGTPLAIVYQTSTFNWVVMRPLISTEHFGLVNLIAQKRLAKEFIHSNFTVELLSEELFRLLEKDENKEMRAELLDVKNSLGEGGTAKKVAEAVLRIAKK
jgi:lipid-A-disaccharide synthase